MFIGLEEEMAKYSKGRAMHKKGKRKDEGDILATLNSFRSRLQSTIADRHDDDGEDDDDDELHTKMHVDGTNGEEDAAAAVLGAGEDDPGMEVDNDTGFLSHALCFPKDNSEEVNKAQRDYEVIDPRQRGARAKEEERERKQKMKPKDGGRGFRR